MNKRELALLEKAFDAEVRGALSGSIPLIQTRSALARKLVDDGMLTEATITLPSRTPFGAITVSGYELTHLGRLAYCSTCDDEVAK